MKLTRKIEAVRRNSFLCYRINGNTEFNSVEQFIENNRGKENKRATRCDSAGCLRDAKNIYLVACFILYLIFLIVLFNFF